MLATFLLMTWVLIALWGFFFVFKLSFIFYEVMNIFVCSK